ncbi:MAG: phosphoribosylaminoimidazolesuccinocarboxamide synthase [Candidatus Thermoplasmatota archaeon]
MVVQTVVQTELPFKILNRGKVRDLYEIDNKLLIVATDRISAFDHVLPDPIPKKGICLTQLSKFWFEFTQDIVPNHFITADIEKYPAKLREHKTSLKYRSMLVKKAKVLPVECIVRGYISGSAWNSYKQDGTVCGIKLRKGLRESDKFDEPLFTPSTKAASGHDINISFEKMKNIIGLKNATKLKEYSLALYSTAADYALKRGIIIADTKFEFGVLNNEIILVDEILTPDSSRFWPADSYEPGKPQPSFDKQYVRDYLLSIGYDKDSTPPHLPDSVIQVTQQKYQDAYELLTGKKFSFR